MKYVPGVSGRAVLSLAIVAVNYLLAANAQIQSGQVSIQSVQGSATYESLGQIAQLQANQLLSAGTLIRTAPNATVDLILQYNGTALRLLPNSVLSIDKLNKESTGDETITETSLNLHAGSLIGSQRKLAPPSRFDINIPGGVATIKGTIYDVRADGTVT